MDLTYFSTLTFKESELTKITCPFCEHGKLLLAKGTVNCDCSSIIEELDPEDVDYVFSGILKCNNQECRAPISCGGAQIVYKKYDDSPEGWSWHETLHPKWFYPHINLFYVHSDCPEQVIKEIYKSFSVFFYDPCAAGVHVRIALERLMDEEGIPPTKLHARLESYKEIEPELAVMLMAIKWLGNEASHSGQLTKTDILDGYEVISHVFTERYERRAREARAVSKTASLIIKFKP